MLVNEDDSEFYRLSILRNTGYLYEYETEDKNRLYSKIKKLNSSSLFWAINEKKVNHVKEVYEWLGFYEEA